MNAQTRTDEMEKAAQVFGTTLRERNEFAARCEQLEAAIAEMEKEHADAVEDMIGSHESEVSELRAALQASERLNKYLDELLHVHEANGNIRLLASENVGTILKTVRDMVNQAAEDWARAETNALAKDNDMRRKPRPEPVTYQYPEGPVTVRQIDTSELLRRIEDGDDTAPIAPDESEDNGEPVPQFLSQPQQAPAN